MQSSAPPQLALHYMQLRNEKLSEIPVLVCLQHGQELAGRPPILYPCQGQVRMKRTVFGGETERDEGIPQTLSEAS
jgi:hypothetical protein